MSISARLRSSIALVIVAVLLGTPALPLALCLAEGGQVHCAADMPRQAGSDHGCHDSDTPPPASMSCCCDRDAGAVPLAPPTIADAVGAPLSLAVSPVEPVMPDGAVAAGIANTVLLTRHRPLFTLFSAFLI
jgi:hypothetical protein